MRAVGVKELRDHLSEYVRFAHAGEVVLVTDRDRVVAELSAPSTARAPHVRDAVVEELVRLGLARAPTSRSAEPPPRMAQVSTAELLAELAADREDR